MRMLNASTLTWPLTVRTRIEPSRSVFFSAWKTLSKNSLFWKSYQIRDQIFLSSKKPNFRNLTRRVRKTQRRHKETLNSTTLRTDRNFINRKLKQRNISKSIEYFNLWKKAFSSKQMTRDTWKNRSEFLLACIGMVM